MFENRRESYFWLLDELDIYKPNVWEFSRFTIENNFVSKRYIKELVQEGVVAGWDDPRLITLKGLRRRGVPAEAINDLCRITGVTWFEWSAFAQHFTLSDRMSKFRRSFTNFGLRGFVLLVLVGDWRTWAYAWWKKISDENKAQKFGGVEGRNVAVSNNLA